jgi:hypothetical protein
MCNACLTFRDLFGQDREANLEIRRALHSREERFRESHEWALEEYAETLRRLAEAPSVIGSLTQEQRDRVFSSDAGEEHGYTPRRR